MKKLLLFSFLALVGAFSSMATLRMPAYYGNHMVLQRDVPVLLRGEAEPGKRVTAVLGDNKATVKPGKTAVGKYRFLRIRLGALIRCRLRLVKKCLISTIFFLERCGYVADSRIWNFVCVQQLMPRRK